MNSVSRLLMVAAFATVAGIGAVTARQVLMVNIPAALAAP